MAVKRRTDVTLCLLVLAFFSLDTVTSQLPRKPRLCCRYSNLGGGSALSTAIDPGSACPSPLSCSVTTLTGSKTIHPPLDRCFVKLDSKRDKTGCFEDDSFTRRNPERVSGIVVRSYLLEDEAVTSAHFDIHGLEIAVPFDLDFRRLKFRIYNNERCSLDEGSGGCSPRCVDVERERTEQNEKETEVGEVDREYFVYDCELGFYSSETKVTSMVHGSTYTLDVCLDDDSCSSFYLQMPGKDESKVMSDQLVLLERDPLLFDAQLVLQFPPDLTTK